MQDVGPTLFSKRLHRLSLLQYQNISSTRPLLITWFQLILNAEMVQIMIR